MGIYEIVFLSFEDSCISVFKNTNATGLPYVCPPAVHIAVQMDLIFDQGRLPLGKWINWLMWAPQLTFQSIKRGPRN
jgi:hypothetical protein